MKKIITLGIMLLFLGMTISSSSGLYLEKQPIKPMSSGNILYVGGDGPGNYTKIQDAIDNASDGDTVFVYNGIYHENVRINKNYVNLIGQNRNTTIIDGGGADWVVLVVKSTNGITISGFTIRNSQDTCVVLDWGSAYNVIAGNKITDTIYGIILWIYTNNNTISDNTFTNCPWGIYTHDRVFHTTISNNILLNGGTGIEVNTDSDNNLVVGNTVTNHNIGIYLKGTCEKVVIAGNILKYNKFGIALDGQDWYYLTIWGNTITENKFGIALDGVSYGNISYNTIDSNYCCGILFWAGNHDVDVYRNDIKNNINFFGGGLKMVLSWNNTISYNNFMNNRPNARFVYCFGMKNTWNRNYWDKPRSFPYLIFGRTGPLVFPIIITPAFLSLILPWVNIDWHPAKEPIDWHPAKEPYEILEGE